MKSTSRVPSSCASALARRQVLDYMSSSHTAPTVKNRLCIYFPHICCYKPPISQYIHTYIHTYMPTFIPIRCSPLLSDTEVTSSSELTYLRRAPVHWHDAKCWIVVSIIPHGTNSEKPPLYLLPTSAATSHRLANTTDDHR